MPELPPIVDIPSQPSAAQLAAWLAEHDSALTVESVGEGLRVGYRERPGVGGRRPALGMARARLESADCPWSLAADAVNEDGQQTSRVGRDSVAVLVCSITPEESAARREARARARQEKRDPAGSPAEQAPARKGPAAGPMVEPLAVNRAVRAIPAGELPVLGYSHGPDHYHGHTEPSMFRPLDPEPVVRAAHPERGAGLWTSPALEQDADGTVLTTAWSQWWDDHCGDNRYSEHLRIVPSPSARIVLIDSHDDLAALVRQYPNPPADLPYDDSHLYPDWVAVSGDWDAVYLTEDGVLATAAEDPDSATAPHLTGWDIAAVVWLNPAYTVADGLGL